VTPEPEEKKLGGTQFKKRKVVEEFGREGGKYGGASPANKTILEEKEVYFKAAKQEEKMISRSRSA